MGEFVKSLFFALAFAAIAGLAGGLLIAGLLTGSINGPAKGRDIIALASQPLLFTFMALFHLIVAVGSAIGAYKLMRGAPV